MARSNHFIYAIVRIVLAILSMITMIVIALKLFHYIGDSHGHKDYHGVDNVVCGSIGLLIASLGFYGAYHEHFDATLVFAIAQTILLITDLLIYTRDAQVFAAIFAYIYGFLLHRGGSVPFFD